MKFERKMVNETLWGYAREIDRLNTEIKSCNELIKDLEYSLKATVYDGIGVKGHSMDSVVERSAFLRGKFFARIEKAMTEKDKCMRKFEMYISPLRMERVQMLRMRYMEGMKPREIARRMHLSESYTAHSIGGSQEFLYRYHKKMSKK